MNDPLKSYFASGQRISHSLLNFSVLFLRKEIILGKETIDTSVFTKRLIEYLGYEYAYGDEKSPRSLSVTFCTISRSYYDLTKKNPIFFHHLILRNVTKKTQNYFSFLLNRHGSIIETIDVSYCHQMINDTVLKDVGEKSPQLTNLNIWGCHKVTNNGILFITQHCHLLQYLNVGGCFRLTDSICENIGKDLLYLHHLNLSGCKALTDKCMKYLFPYPSRVILLLDEKKNLKVSIRSEDLKHMQNQLKKYGETNVSYRQIFNQRHELILCFHEQLKEKTLNIWLNPEINMKYKPSLSTLDDNQQIFSGKFYPIQMHLLNITHCDQIHKHYIQQLQKENNTMIITILQ